MILKKGNLKKNKRSVHIFRSFLFIFFFITLFLGPKDFPPPTHKGDLVEPARALPVPFCFQGFLPPPFTSAFVLQCAEYCWLFLRDKMKIL